MMAQILDAASMLSGKSELELFSVPPTQVAIDNGYWLEAHLKNTLSNSGPFEFELTQDPFYLDLSHNYIYMQLKITKEDGSDVDAPTVEAGVNKYPVAPINLIGKTFFKTVKLWLNNKLCYDSGDLYAYRSYLETMLNYGKEAKDSHLQAALYFSDVAGLMNDKKNTGFRQRGKWCKESRTLEVMAGLHTDISNQSRLMVNHINVKLELHRNSDDFCLMSLVPNSKFKIKLLNMSWYVRRVDLLKTLSVGLEMYLSKNVAKYPIRRDVNVRTAY